jgi:hypothetical protein
MRVARSLAPMTPVTPMTPQVAMALGQQAPAKARLLRHSSQEPPT